jgi:hypothetical protein
MLMTVKVRAALLAVLGFGVSPAAAGAAVSAPPQGYQSDAAFAASYAAHHVSSVLATAQRVSCYAPEVLLLTGLPTQLGFPDPGGTPCPGATTGEDVGPFPTQDQRNPPLLVKDHSESDLHVDPTDPRHLIGLSKWFVNAEGYNHLTGFFESFDGGATWPQQGHVPGWEGWTDNSDPVGAFDPWGNFYALILPYEFDYNANGTHDVLSPRVNPSVARMVLAVAVRPHGAATADAWLTTHDGKPDEVASAPFLGEPAFDKQWIAIDTNRRSKHFGRVYAMWAVYGSQADSRLKIVVSHADAHPNGTHSDWSTPRFLPGLPPGLEENNALPHLAPDGTVWTTVSAVAHDVEAAEGDAQAQTFAARVSVLSSRNGGVTWNRRVAVAHQAVPAYRNTTFRSAFGIAFAVGTKKVRDVYPLYIAYEQESAKGASVALTASFDSGRHWRKAIRVEDSRGPGEALQPNLAVAPDGTVAVAFYDRRLRCPADGTPEAIGAGLAFDPLAPFGRADYCINTALQLYRPGLRPMGHNIRLTPHTWDPQLSAARWSCACQATSFIGDYFGVDARGGFAYTSAVTTYDEGGLNPLHHQQQLVSKLALP